MRLCIALTAAWLTLTAITVDAWLRLVYPLAPRTPASGQDLEELETLVGCRSDNGARACVP